MFENVYECYNTRTGYTRIRPYIIIITFLRRFFVRFFMNAYIFVRVLINVSRMCPRLPTRPTVVLFHVYVLSLFMNCVCRLLMVITIIPRVFFFFFLKQQNKQKKKHSRQLIIIIITIVERRRRRRYELNIFKSHHERTTKHRGGSYRVLQIRTSNERAYIKRGSSIIIISNNVYTRTTKQMMCAVVLVRHTHNTPCTNATAPINNT